MDEERTTHRTHTQRVHWYDQPAGSVEMWGTIYRLKPEYDFREWRPAAIVSGSLLIGIVLAAWLAHLPPAALYFLVAADLALAAIIWNTSGRH